MLTPRLTNCQDCHKIPDLLKSIDCKLAELGNNMYNNVVFMLGRDVPAYTISQLLAYKRILTFKYCNPSYAGTISVNDIAAKVIRLTSGCVSRCNTPTVCEITTCCVTVVPNPITTTTSTSSTTTTTTTVIPTTSTTTSTTTLDPDCRVEGCFQVRDFPPVPSCDEPFNTNNPEGFPNNVTGNGTKTLSNGVVLTTTYTGPDINPVGGTGVFEVCDGYFANRGGNGTSSLFRLQGIGRNNGVLTMQFNPPINSVAFVSGAWGFNTNLGETEVVSIESLTPITGEQMMSCSDPGVDPTYETIQVNANQVNIQGVQNVPSSQSGATIITAESGGIEELVVSMVNGLAGITLDFYVCPGTAPTTTTTTSSSPPVDPPCTDGLDVAFVIDYTFSMSDAIERVKAGVAGIVNTIATEAGAGGYRLALVTSDESKRFSETIAIPNYYDCIDYELLSADQRRADGPFEAPFIRDSDEGRQTWTTIFSTAWEMFSMSNQASFNTQLQKLNNGVPGTLCVQLGGGLNGPEPTDYGSQLITTQNLAGAFRSNVAKYIIIITDAFPSGTSDQFNLDTWNGIQDMITYANANGIKYFILGPGVNKVGSPSNVEFQESTTAVNGIYPWRELAEQTGGSWNSSFDPQTIQDEIISGCNPTTTTTTTSGIPVTGNSYFTFWSDTSGSMDDTVSVTAQIASVTGVKSTVSGTQTAGQTQIRLVSSTNASIRVTEQQGGVGDPASKSFLCIVDGMEAIHPSIPSGTFVEFAGYDPSTNQPTFDLLDSGGTSVALTADINAGLNGIITFNLTDAQKSADYTNTSNLRNLLQDFYATGGTEASGNTDRATNGSDEFEARVYWCHSGAERQISMLSNKGLGGTIDATGYFPDADSLVIMAFGDESGIGYNMDGDFSGNAWENRNIQTNANIKEDIENLRDFVEDIEAAAGNTNIYRAKFFHPEATSSYTFSTIKPLVSPTGLLNAGINGADVLTSYNAGQPAQPAEKPASAYGSADNVQDFPSASPARFAWSADLDNSPTNPEQYWYDQIRNALIDFGYGV
jgi:hypothetical protein